MVTQLLPESSLEQCTPPGVHWVCVTIEDHPYVALCGELTSGRHVSGAAMCPTCLELAPEHVLRDQCSPCAAWVGRVA